MQAAISASSTVSSARTELVIANQAAGSKLNAHAIRIGEMKLLWGPSLTYDMPGWYPPPGLEWNYSTTLTVKCGQPPSSMTGNLCADEASACLYNLTADPCEYRNLASEQPAVVAQLKARLSAFQENTVLTWVNFGKYDEKSLPTSFGPTTPIVPDPQVDGPHTYQGVWTPWLTKAEASSYYPESYDGPGYPTGREL
jgi:hypothetical protein